ncbi:MAG TPA: MFS transporter [Limnochordales bacterium]
MDRPVSLGLSLRYGAGYAGIAIVTQTVLVWLAYFYAPPAEAGLPSLLPIAWVGAAMLVGRAVDAVSDPLVAAWSDATRSRLGRRRPFMLLGALPLAVTFALLWWPPMALSTTALAVYLAVMVSLFLLFFTVYTAPYLALLPELGRTRAERVGLATWQAVFQILGLAVAMVGSGFLIEQFGFGGMGLALAALSLLTFLITALGVPEAPSSSSQPPSLGVVESALLTLRNGPYVHYVLSHVLFWIGLNAVVVGAPYFVTVMMGGSEADASVALALTFVVAVLCFPFMGRLSNRRGLKWTMQVSMVALAAALLLWGLVGRWPGPVGAFGQGLIVFAVAGVGVAGLFVLPNAMVAEIADYDERLHGMRREAMFFGVQGFLVKTAMGLSSYGTTWLLETFGYTGERALGLVFLGPLAALFVLAGIAVLSGYREDVVRGETGVPYQTTPPASSRI